MGERLLGDANRRVATVEFTAKGQTQELWPQKSTKTFGHAEKYLSRAYRRLEGFAGHQVLVPFRGQKERHRLSGALSFMGRQPHGAVGVLAHRCVVYCAARPPSGEQRKGFESGGADRKDGPFHAVSILPKK
jgi:hypothetical protein